MRACTLATLLLAPVSADVYMHNPPGSNDRNRERNDNRNNGNRMFDSQNNGNGGYPWRGDATTVAGPDPLGYMEGSVLELKWTQQHACGRPLEPGSTETTHCNIVIQYACEGDTLPGLRDGYPTGATQTQANNNGNNDDNNQAPQYLERIFQNNNQNQDGTNTIPNNEQQAGCINDVGEDGRLRDTSGLFAGSTQLNSGVCNPCNNEDAQEYTACEFGMHEDYYWYNTHCRNRERNKGLYTADRKLNRDDASATRQNPNGARSGLECPEERDYYPYWHPTPFVDIAVQTSDPGWCAYYQEQSQNVMPKYYCDVSKQAIDNNNDYQEAPITEGRCLGIQGARWQKVEPYSAWPSMASAVTGPPDCALADFTPQNSLGFTANTDLATDYSTYKWTVPNFGLQQGESKKCVLRLRYNISTEDYPSMAGFTKTASIGGTSNGQAPMDSESQVANSEEGFAGIFDYRYNCPYLDSKTPDGNDPDAASAGTGSTSPFDCYSELATKLRPRYNRPEIYPFGETEPSISIALNTDQAGRTFQDRSYVFEIVPRDPNIPAQANIVNLNVLGKRGNIVQAYPAVEYDFVPRHPTITQDDFIHVQLHGSDFNNEKNPNNGEGWKYSDRTNIMQMTHDAHSFPSFVGEAGQELPNRVNPFFTYEDAKALAYLGQKERLQARGHTCKTETEVDDEQNDPRLCGKLNFAPATFKHMIAGGSRSPGTYAFISTRNNNFSNRSQKMEISVTEGSPVDASAVAAGAVGTVIGLGAIVGIVVVIVLVVTGKIVIGTDTGGSQSAVTNTRV